MPNTNEYHLYIHVDEKEKETESPVSNSSAENTENNQVTNEQFMTKAKKIAAYGTVKGFVTQILSNGISTIELRTGAAEYQQKMQFAYDIGLGLYNIAEKTYLGAKFGGGVGAAIGLAIGTMHTAISYAQAQNVIDLNRTLESMTITQNNVRAGTANRRLNY
jgi:hypothetical protein